MTTRVQSLSQETFERDVAAADRPVLVDFYADWCGPCKAIAPVVAQLADEYDGRVDVRNVDVDSDPGLASRFGVRSIPTLILFKEGEPVETVVGAVGKPALRDLFEKHAG